MRVNHNYLVQEGGEAVGAESSQMNEGQQIEQVCVDGLVCCTVSYTMIFVQTSLTELKTPLKLKWRRGEDMPFAMDNGIQAVVIGDDVYVGGGYSAYGRADTVMVYSLQTGSWRILPVPPYESRYFGMAVINNQLVLVGGESRSTGRATNVLSVWDQRSQTWTHPFPVMPTGQQSPMARVHKPMAISYQKWLIVAGGNVGGARSDKVELLDSGSGQWYEGPPLPGKYSEMSSAINGNMWYLSGGFSSLEANKHVLSVCLDELISQAVSQSTTPSRPSPWQTLPEPPLTFSTALVLNGALLTVGGWDSSSIHLYQPGRRSWVKVGDLPAELWSCACTTLPSGEIFVAGGVYGSSSKELHIASII